MADCRTVRQETSEYDFFASVGDHRESPRRFRIVPGAPHLWRPPPSVNPPNQKKRRKITRYVDSLGRSRSLALAPAQIAQISLSVIGPIPGSTPSGPVSPRPRSQLRRETGNQLATLGHIQFFGQLRLCRCDLPPSVQHHRDLAGNRMKLVPNMTPIHGALHRSSAFARAAMNQAGPTALDEASFNSMPRPVAPKSL